MLTLLWWAVLALRMRVSMSAMVSLVIGSPGGLLDTRDQPQAGMPPEADPAHPELAHEGARPAAQPAAVVLLDPVLGGSQALGDQRFLGHVSPSRPGSAGSGRPPRDRRGCYHASCPRLAHRWPGRSGSPRPCRRSPPPSRGAGPPWRWRSGTP